MALDPTGGSFRSWANLAVHPGHYGRAGFVTLPLTLWQRP